MNREVHVRFWESAGVKFPRATRLKLAAVILDDRELDRILAHQGWPTEFPKTKASRAPPGSVERGDESSQADPQGEGDGRQDFPSEWPA